MTFALLLLALADTTSIPTVEEDTVAIEQLIAAELSGEAVVDFSATELNAIRPSKMSNAISAPKPVGDDRLVAFEALGGMLGRTVRFTTTSGHSHVAIVDAVNGGTVRLLVRMPGGQATYNLTRGQISYITRL
jgi:hypothetical protein